MSQTQVLALPEDEAVQQIIETIQNAEPGAAPFALVLGSGFSHGLVPTAREIVEVSLPLWMKSRAGEATFEDLLRIPGDHRTVARSFWERFAGRNANRGLSLSINGGTGLPNDNAAAYRAAFDPRYTGALGEPGLARKFQRSMMRLDQPRLNGAHFLLASLLGIQPGQSRRNDLFKARAAFSRLILTTNFDPFLQIALQSANRLYFMSDTPELGIGDEILDEQPDAIHLVYLHGSIHRRSQAATDSEIQALKEKNARTLAPVLKRHGVIVVGYSGWDDAIVEALAACDRFDHRLYWCGRESDPLASGAFGPRVAAILQKPTANYVQISNAGHFMARLSVELVRGLPRLLDNPIAQLREMLQTIDLTEFESIEPSAQVNSSGPQLPSAPEALASAQKSVIERLLSAEQVFAGAQVTFLASGTLESPGSSNEPSDSNLHSTAAHLLSSARAAVALADYGESIELFTQALDIGRLGVSKTAQVLLERGIAFYFSGKLQEGQADWSTLLELPGAPVEQIAKALNNRGFTWGQKGDSDKEIADYTSVIELPGAPVEQIAKALYNRGLTWGQKGNSDKEIADYTRVIELPGAPVEQIAKALYNRGVRWGEKGDSDNAIADYTRVIEQLPGAPVEHIAEALYSRGVTWGRKGDSDKEVADYTRVIEQLPGAPVEQIAKALNNRGFTWGQKGDSDKEIADYTSVIELPGAPVEQIAKALYNRGLTWGQKGNSDKEIADYTRVIELPGAPVEQIAKALYNRGVRWGEKGDSDNAIADYTRVIEQLPGAPVEHIAEALYSRGVTWGRKGDSDKAIADYTRVIEQLPGAPVEQIAKALNNRGITWGQKGDSDKEIADYTRVIEQLPGAPVEQIAQASANRGWLHYQRNAFPAFLSDTEAAANKNPTLANAAFNLGLALLALGNDEDALSAYQRAVSRFPQLTESIALPDLTQAENTWLTRERALPVRALLAGANVDSSGTEMRATKAGTG